MKRTQSDFYTGKYEFRERYRTFKNIVNEEKCVLFRDVYSIEIWPVIVSVGWCGMGFMMLDIVKYM
jgi:hypothetical protein